MSDSEPFNLRSPDDSIPLELAPLMELEDVDVPSIDDLELKTVDNYEDVLEVLMRRRAIAEGR